jgi:hypothetical protein
MARSLYEGRERPSKTFSWHVFLISNIFVELPWACEFEAHASREMLIHISPYGCRHVLLLVLPDRSLSERCSYRRCDSAWCHGMAFPGTIPTVCVNICVLVRGWNGFLGNCK